MTVIGPTKVDTWLSSRDVLKSVTGCAMDRVQYRAKAIQYIALAKVEESPLMAAQLQNVADAYLRFADGELNPGLSVSFEAR